MSGGSYDYICFKIKQFSYDIRNQENNTLRKEFSEILKDISEVAYAIEWADSCDTSQESANESLRIFFNKWRKTNE